MSNTNSPFNLNTPIQFKDKLPDSVDAVVIGGGIIGVCSALYLNRMGQKVLLCEKGRIAAEQSSRNWGWVRQQGRDEDELPIMMHSNKLWQQLDNDLKGQTGFTQQGVTYLASSEKELSELEKWIAIAAAEGLKSSLLSSKQLSEMISQGDGAHKWVGGVTTPSDGRAEPWQAVPAIAKMAQAEGVLIRENCAVRGLEITDDKITEVITEDGTVKTTQAVLAAGAWSSLFTGQYNVDMPQLTVRSSVARTAPLPNISNGNAADEKLAFRRRADGGYSLALCDYHDHYIGKDSFRNFKAYMPVMSAYLRGTKLHAKAPAGYPDAWGTARKWQMDEVSPFEKMRVIDPKPAKDTVKRMQERFSARFPQIGEPEILNAWGGMIDTMPDVVPIVDHCLDIKGLIIATGMSGHGFGIGPAYGQIIAEMLTGKTLEFNMNRFRFTRFKDGSKLRPGPGL